MTRSARGPGAVSRGVAALRALANHGPRSREQLAALRDRQVRRLVAHATTTYAIPDPPSAG